MSYRLIVTGRCGSWDYGAVSTKILSIVPSDGSVTLVLSGGLTSLNEICEALAGYKGWKIDRDLTSLSQTSAARMKNMAQSGADKWLVVGRKISMNAGGAKYFCDKEGIDLDIFDSF